MAARRDVPPAIAPRAACERCGGAVDFARAAIAPRAPGPLAGLLLGFGAFVRGVKFLFTRSRTKRYALLPLLISAVIVAATFFGLWWGTEGLRASLASADWMPEWVRAVTRYALSALVVLLFLLFAWAASAPIASAISAPFLDPLVGRVDEEVLGRRAGVEAPFVRDTAFSVVQALAILPVLLACSLTALVLALIPVAGPFVSFGFLALGFGISGIDIAGSRRRWTLRQKLRVTAANLPAVVGFGAAGALLGFVPVLPIAIGIPASAIGATLLLYSLDLRPAAVTAR